MTIQSLLKIKSPIIQAPMAGVQDYKLALAVDKAGGLGSIPCGMLTPEQVVEQIEGFTSISGSPYNLNFFCHPMPKMNEVAMASWLAKLQPYYQEFKLNAKLDMAGLRRPFDLAMLNAIAPYQPPIISFHFGLPQEPLINRIKSWGAKILATATTLEEGLWLEQRGVDVVIAQGIEAGGHRGIFLSQELSSQTSTLELVSELSTHLSVPIVGAGGIATNDDIKLILGSGGAGVQLGTAYLLSDEVNITSVHRQALMDNSQSTQVTNLFSGRPARGVVNRLMKELGAINSSVPDFPYAACALNPLKAKAQSLGVSDFTPLWAGEKYHLAQSISATCITREFAEVTVSNS